MTRWILPLALFASLNFGSASGGALNEGDSVSCSKKTADCTIDLVLTEVNTPDGCSVSVSMTIKCCETTC